MADLDVTTGVWDARANSTWGMARDTERGLPDARLDGAGDAEGDGDVERDVEGDGDVGVGEGLSGDEEADARSDDVEADTEADREAEPAAGGGSGRRCGGEGGDKGARVEEGEGLVSPLEAAIEEERARLMLADSVLGCLQIALDPEAVRVLPEPYFPEVVELARGFINKSVRRLEYAEIQRLLQRSMGCYR